VQLLDALREMTVDVHGHVQYSLYLGGQLQVVNSFSELETALLGYGKELIHRRLGPAEGM
jgi:hypothetical protein